MEPEMPSPLSRSFDSSPTHAATSSPSSTTSTPHFTDDTGLSIIRPPAPTSALLDAIHAATPSSSLSQIQHTACCSTSYAAPCGTKGGTSHHPAASTSCSTSYSTSCSTLAVSTTFGAMDHMLTLYDQLYEATSAVHARDGCQAGLLTSLKTYRPLMIATWKHCLNASRRDSKRTKIILPKLPALLRVLQKCRDVMYWCMVIESSWDQAQDFARDQVSKFESTLVKSLQSLAKRMRWSGESEGRSVDRKGGKGKEKKREKSDTLGHCDDCIHGGAGLMNVGCVGTGLSDCSITNGWLPGDVGLMLDGGVNKSVRSVTPVGTYPRFRFIELRNVVPRVAPLELDGCEGFGLEGRGLQPIVASGTGEELYRDGDDAREQYNHVSGSGTSAVCSLEHGSTVAPCGTSSTCTITQMLAHNRTSNEALLHEYSAQTVGVSNGAADYSTAVSTAACSTGSTHTRVDATVDSSSTSSTYTTCTRSCKGRDSNSFISASSGQDHMMRAGQSTAGLEHMCGTTPSGSYTTGFAGVLDSSTCAQSARLQLDGSNAASIDCNIHLGPGHPHPLTNTTGVVGDSATTSSTSFVTSLHTVTPPLELSPQQCGTYAPGPPQQPAGGTGSDTAATSSTSFITSLNTITPPLVLSPQQCGIYAPGPPQDSAGGTDSELLLPAAQQDLLSTLQQLAWMRERHAESCWGSVGWAPVQQSEWQQAVQQQQAVQLVEGDQQQAVQLVQGDQQQAVQLIQEDQQQAVQQQVIQLIHEDQQQAVQRQAVQLIQENQQQAAQLIQDQQQAVQQHSLYALEQQAVQLQQLEQQAVQLQQLEQQAVQMQQLTEQMQRLEQQAAQMQQLEGQAVQMQWQEQQQAVQVQEPEPQQAVQMQQPEQQQAAQIPHPEQQQAVHMQQPEQQQAVDTQQQGQQAVQVQVQAVQLDDRDGQSWHEETAEQEAQRASEACEAVAVQLLGSRGAAGPEASEVQPNAQEQSGASQEPAAQLHQNHMAQASALVAWQQAVQQRLQAAVQRIGQAHLQAAVQRSEQQHLQAAVQRTGQPNLQAAVQCTGRPHVLLQPPAVQGQPVRPAVHPVLPGNGYVEAVPSIAGTGVTRTVCSDTDLNHRQGEGSGLMQQQGERVALATTHTGRLPSVLSPWRWLRLAQRAQQGESDAWRGQSSEFDGVHVPLDEVQAVSGHVHLDGVQAVQGHAQADGVQVVQGHVHPDGVQAVQGQGASCTHPSQSSCMQQLSLSPPVRTHSERASLQSSPQSCGALIRGPAQAGTSLSLSPLLCAASSSSAWNGTVSGEGQNGTLFGEGRNGTLSDEGRNGTVSGEGRNSTISDEARNGTLSDEGRNGTLSDGGQNGTWSDEGQNGAMRTWNDAVARWTHRGSLSEAVQSGTPASAGQYSSGTTMDAARHDNGTLVGGGQYGSGAPVVEQQYNNGELLSGGQCDSGLDTEVVQVLAHLVKGRLPPLDMHNFSMLLHRKLDKVLASNAGLILAELLATGKWPLANLMPHIWDHPALVKQFAAAAGYLLCAYQAGKDERESQAQSPRHGFGTAQASPSHVPQGAASAGGEQADEQDAPSFAEREDLRARRRRSDDAICDAKRMLATAQYGDVVALKGPSQTIANLSVMDINGTNPMHDSWAYGPMPDHLGDLTWLHALSLKHCHHIVTLPSTIGRLRDLRSLYISHCRRLVTLPADVSSLVRLTSLTISACVALESLPRAVCDMPQLASLSIKACDALVALPRQISKLTQLTKLVVQRCESVAALPAEVCELLSLKVLDLEGSWRVDQLPVGLGNLFLLTGLCLRGCRLLRELPVGISKLKKLEKLDLDGCRALEVLPAQVGRCQALKRLGLKCCSSLRSLPNQLSRLTALELLNVHECSMLESLPPGIGNLALLSELDLGRCSALRHLPPEIGRLTGLRMLNLEHCSQLQCIPVEIGRLSQLGFLKMQECVNLTCLPGQLGQLSRLAFLCLRNCTQLRLLPPEISDLASLTRFDLGGCSALEALPDNLGSLSLLARLTLTNCTSLTSLPDSLTRLSNLMHLFLSDCTALASLPQGFGNLSHLSTVTLRHCPLLPSLPSIKGLNRLKLLDLADCTSLSSLPAEISTCSCLQILDVSGCTNLARLPSGISILPNLDTLYLENFAQLDSLPPGINQLNRLRSIHVMNPRREIQLRAVTSNTLYFPAEYPWPCLP